MEQIIPPTKNNDTVTFKRSHLYSVLVVFAFAVGVLVGYMAWGRGGGASPSAANNNPPAADAAAEGAPRRYDIPTEGFPSTGPKDAPITLVEFSDYQCPFCQRWHDEVYAPLLAAYPGQIRLVYRSLPLTQIHPQAMNSAEAAMCAGDQDAYWQFHDKLFENSQLLSDDLYASLASDLGLDTTAFETCMTGHKYKADIEADMQFAIDLGVQSTPTFFINGLAIVGAQPLSAFQSIIDDELAGKIP
jgi:protein-disulfide isomerase